MTDSGASQRPPFIGLHEAIRTGRAILVLGDQFVELEQSRSTEPTYVASVRSALSAIYGAEGGDANDQRLSLSELHALARSASPQAASEEIRKCRNATLLGLDEWPLLLNGPWQRIYDLTGAASALARKQGLPTIDPTDDSGFDRRLTQLIDFGGSGPHPYETPTGLTGTPRDTWFRQFSADIVSNPVVLVAAGTHPELWSYLSARRNGGELGVSPAVLYCEQASSSDRAMLTLHAVDCQIASISRLARGLRSDVSEVIQGGQRRAQIQQLQTEAGRAMMVSRLLSDGIRLSDPWRFLRGYDPTWNDISSGRAVRLSRLSSIYRELRLVEGRRNVVLVKGRAGSGKTAMLMRLAYELHAKGRTVVWLDRSLNATVKNIADRVIQLAPDVALVDDINVFGDAGESLLRRLNRGGRTAVVASIRRTQLWNLEGTHFASVDGDSDLTNSDLANLVKALTDAGLLGVLQGKAETERVDTLGEICKRDLLSALIEVVTGQAFEDRIASEYEELAASEKALYTAVCLSGHIYETEAIPEDDLLQTAGSVNDYARLRHATTELIESRKLILRYDGGLIARHRAIADAVVNALGPGIVRDYMKRMLELYASRAANVWDQSNPDRRLMVHLLSHTRMRRLGVGKTAVREIYASVQTWCAKDYHYWLQRGAYEVEHGDLDLAETYLKSARSLPGALQDHLVTTEWGFMRLRRAIRSPRNGDDSRKAGAALDELVSVTRAAGSSSPHTFAVIIRHGAEWLRTSLCLTEGEIYRNVEKIIETIQLAERVCADNREVLRSIQGSRAVLAELGGPAAEEGGPRYPL